MQIPWPIYSPEVGEDQQHRRGYLSLDEAREFFSSFAEAPTSLFEIDSGVIVHDALFLRLAEDAGTLVVTVDGKLIRSLDGTSFAHLAHPLSGVGDLLS